MEASNECSFSVYSLGNVKLVSERLIKCLESAKYLNAKLDDNQIDSVISVWGVLYSWIHILRKL